MDVGLGLAAMAWLLLLFWAPGSGPVWRARLRLADRLERLAGRLRHRRHRPPDPFATIQLQHRLGVLAEQIRHLEEDRHVYAKAHRLIAHRAAYDDLLDEAFRMAGLPLPEQGRGEARRLDAELELTGRGWSW